MADWKKYTGTTVDEAFTKACIDFGMPSSELEMVVTQKDSAGILGLFRKEAEIQVRVKKAEAPAKSEPAEAPKKTPEKKAEPAKKAEPVKKEEPAKKAEPEKKAEPAKKAEPEKKEEPVKKAEKAPEAPAKSKPAEAPKAAEVKDEPAEEAAEEKKLSFASALPSNVTVDEFLKNVLSQMGIDAEISITKDEEENALNIDIEGSNMGLLIGKRGQTLDALQYLASLVVNKGHDEYVKVKLDTENYRERRKATLENLAKNIASKVKKTHRSVTLEPMNPYERRIIHATLQNDRYVETHSEGEEPNRCVVVTLKKEYKDYDFNRGRGGYGNKKYNNNNRGGGNRKNGNGRYNNRRYNNNSRKDGNRENRGYGEASEAQQAQTEE